MVSHGRKNMPCNWIFQQDNDPKHTSTHLKKFYAEKKSNFWIGQARIWILILLNISGMNWIDVFIVEVTQIRISSLLPYWKNGHNFHSSDCKILCIQCQIDVLLWSKLEGMQQNTDFFLRVQDIFVLLLHTWLTN